MTIIQRPDALSLSGNIKKFIIASTAIVNFTLKDGGATLLETTYEPGADGRVEIDVKDIIESRLSFTLLHNSFYQQPNIAKTFTATIDSTDVVFKAIRAGIENFADTPTNWLHQNFLTWQDTNKLVTYYSPEWITYFATEASKLILRAHFNNAADEIIELGIMNAGSAYTANVQYAVVVGLLGQKYPTHYDVIATSATGTLFTYTQRYLYSEPKSELEQWFLFENSLGGIDTLRAGGDTDFEAEHEHKIASIDGENSEYRINTKRTFAKNTGHLNEYERRWLLDFPPARAKYVHYGAAIRKIIVSETDFKYSASELPSNFTFKYRFVNDFPYLNLIRNEGSISEAIIIPDIDSPDFILPPRLSEYPRVTLSEGVIIPVFDPHTNTPQTTTIGALSNAIIEGALQQVPGASEGGAMVKVLSENSVLEPDNKNVFSALRTLKEIASALSSFFTSLTNKFLRKDVPDSANGLITFRKGLISKEKVKLEKGAEFGKFSSGMFTGKGGRIDEKGNGELESLIIRSLLEVPEIRYNRLTLVGEEICIGAGGIILEVTPQNDPDVFLLKMKLEEGELIPFAKNDIVKGIYNQQGGFHTSWFRVDVVDQEAQTITVTMGADAAVPNNKNYPPKPFMNIARRGNFTDASRQTSLFLSAKDGNVRMLDGVDNYMAGVRGFQLGKPAGLEDVIDFSKLPINQNQGYLYARGLIVQDLLRIDYQGKPIREIRDRGIWSLDVAQGDEPYRCTATLQDDAWVGASKFRCIVDKTINKPEKGSTDWLPILLIDDVINEVEDKIPVSWELIPVSDKGVNAFNYNAQGQLNTLTYTIKFLRSGVDVTAIMQQSTVRLYEFFRKNTFGVDDNGVSDESWNAAHMGATSITLTHEDIFAVGTIGAEFDEKILEEEYQKLK